MIPKRESCVLPQILGITVVGERGQVVIPAKARNQLRLKKGDNLMVLLGGPKGNMLMLVPVSEMEEFVRRFSFVAQEFEKHRKKLKK